MVKRTTPSGAVYHEPPYTSEEEAWLHGRMCGPPLSVVRPTPEQRRADQPSAEQPTTPTGDQKS
jgi:hypothetical protein